LGYDYGSFVGGHHVFLLIRAHNDLALITSTSKGGLRGGLETTIGVMAGDKCRVLRWQVFSVMTAYPADVSVPCGGWLEAHSRWLGM
jgi:hypothetical protein